MRTTLISWAELMGWSDIPAKQIFETNPFPLQKLAPSEAEEGKHGYPWIDHAFASA